jgi:Tfp pilus assembly protein PilN
MIRINLSPDRKVRRKTSKGEQTLGIGVVVVIAAAALVFLFVHRPLSDDIDEQQRANSELRNTNTKIAAQTKDLAQLRAAVEASKQQEAAIDRLNAARAVPSWMLYELSQILTTGGSPSITEDTQKDMENNPNRRFQEGWDPKHVWITSFIEKGGQFKLEGGSQADSDMTQLALRLQASMFFDNVIPEGGKEAKSATGANYYTYTITGSVRY